MKDFTLKKRTYIANNMAPFLARLMDSDCSKDECYPKAKAQAAALYDRLKDDGMFSTSTKEPQKKHTPESKELFELFWDAFNDKKRSAKKQAKKSFLEISPTKELAEQIIFAAGESYKEAVRGEGLSFRKHAFRWLDAGLYSGYEAPTVEKIKTEAVNHEVLEIKNDIAYFKTQKGEFYEGEVKRLEAKLKELI